jgi:hypothetical protein
MPDGTWKDSFGTLESTAHDATFDVRSYISRICCERLLYAVVLKARLEGMDVNEFIRAFLSREFKLDRVEEDPHCFEERVLTPNLNSEGSIYDTDIHEHLVALRTLFESMKTSDHFKGIDPWQVDMAVWGINSLLTQEAHSFEDLRSGKLGTPGAVVIRMLNNGHTPQEVVQAMIDHLEAQRVMYVDQGLDPHPSYNHAKQEAPQPEEV